MKEKEKLMKERKFFENEENFNDGFLTEEILYNL